MAKYAPKTKVELQELIKNESINLGDIDVSGITDMSNLFYEDEDYNEIKRKDFSGIESWDVSNVTDMSGMFFWCKSFNKPIGNWNVSNVTNMSYMFYLCEAFNQSLENWNVSNVTNMSYMFNWCSAFNQSLGNWDVSNVTDMSGMFFGCKSFNKPIGNWNVSNVTDMSGMFDGCNCDIPSWYDDRGSNNKNCVKYYNSDDEEETTYETWLENNKVMVAINGDRFVFCKNGGDVDFEIPSKALKFLCFKLQMHDDIGIYNKKEFYNGGELKSLEFIAENTFSKYEFSENRKLLSFLTKSGYYEASIKNIEYFSKDDESFVKGTISGWDYIEDFAQFLCLKDIANLYKSDIDTTALLKNGFKITGVPIDMRGIDYIDLTYNKYGTLSCINGPDWYMSVDFDDDGLLERFVMYAYVGGGDMSLETAVVKIDGARDGYAKIRAFNSNLDGRVLEVLGSEFDENGDVISRGDVIVNKTFYTAFYIITCLKDQEGVIYSKDVMDIEYDIDIEEIECYDDFADWDGSKEWFLNTEIGQDSYFVKTTEFEVKKEHLSKVYGALVEYYIGEDSLQFIRYPMVMF